MAEDRGLKTRGPVSSTLDLDLLDKLRKLSTETKVPISKLLDESVEDLLSKRASQK